MSVVSPKACVNSGVQAGVVFGQTRIVSCPIFSKSSGERITLAEPVTLPGLTAKPFSLLKSSAFRF